MIEMKAYVPESNVQELYRQWPTIPNGITEIRGLILELLPTIIV